MFRILFVFLIVLALGLFSVRLFYANVAPSQVTQPSFLSTPSPTPHQFTEISPPELPRNWKTYTNKDKGFSLRYPHDWNITESDHPYAVVKIMKKLPVSSINREHCKPGITNGGTDCYPEVWVEIDLKPKSEKYVSVLQSNECQVFGECTAAEKTEYLSVSQVPIRLEYLREDGIHPFDSFIDLENEVLRVRAYVPTSKNCVGECPVYDDSTEVLEAAKQIKDIITSFKKINSN